jgi:nitrous oxidase accessory protein
MAKKLTAYQNVLEEPISPRARVLLALAILAIMAVFSGPLWTMSFRSNQYPDPLEMSIYIDHLEGQKSEIRDDLREINSLNHYIGMRPLLERDFSEFVWMPFVVGFFVLIILRALVFGTVRDLADVVVLFTYFGLFSAWNFYNRLYAYGHDLAPDAAIEVEPFTPPFFGREKIANFWIESFPGVGSYALALGGLLLLVALLVALRSARAEQSASTAAVAALLVAALAFAGPSAADTLRVGPDAPFTTVGAALLAAAPGDRIEVAAGVYHETLSVDVPVELVGLGEPEIAGAGEGDVVGVVADDVTVRGFAIRGSGQEMMRSNAGIKVFGDRARIAGNRIFDNLFGVYLDGARQAVIEDNEITGRREVDIGRRGAGVHLYASDHNRMSGNRVSFVRDGVYFDHSDFNTVADNTFHHLRYGVHYMYCSDNRFFRNVFRDSLAGVAIMYTERVTFNDNLILHNRAGYHAFGLLMKDALDSVAEGNAIVGNTSGVFLDSSHRNRFVRNLVAHNDVGVVLYASSLENSFADNDFVGNLATLHTVGKASADWNPSGHGNHYSDYAGYDLDGDGRGDVPHRLQDAFEVLEGNHPLLRLFLSSAAADALAAAERSFPLVPSSEQVDSAPAMRPVSGVEVGSGSAAIAGATAPTAGAPPPRGRGAVATGWLLVLAVAGWSTAKLRR